MPAPIARGLIIFASILAAAGIALYEDPYIKQWIDDQRRKIAVALHNLGDGIDLSGDDPDLAEARRNSISTAAEEETRRQTREEIIKRNRNELIRKAKEEGIAVDLDELSRIGSETEEEASVRLVKTLSARDRSDKNKTFDSLVDGEGVLHAETTAAEPAESSAEGMRHRGAGARGLSSGSAFANPFADEGILFDHDDAQMPGQFSRSSTTNSLYALSPTADPAAAPLIDTSPVPDPPTSVPEMATIDHPGSTTHSFLHIPREATASSATLSEHSFVLDVAEDEDDDVPTPSGTLTPAEDSFSTAASMIGSNADDVGAVDLMSDDMSDAGFSHVSGTQTPNSWTDVGSDEESEEEGHHQQQIHHA